MRNSIELERTSQDSITPNSNVLFNAVSPYSDGITYDPVTGDIVLGEIGQYYISWWIATETALTGCIQFAVKSSQGDVLKGCSPTKRGQVAGFGDIFAASAGVTLSLVNTGDCNVFPSSTSPVTAALVAVRIPEDGVIPTFDVDKVETLEPGENATVDLTEDSASPNNWLFSFGIPKGGTGAAGVTPHIDTGTGNWFTGDTDTGVKAQGPKGDAGPVGPSTAIIPFSVGKHGTSLSTDELGNPLMVAFSGFGGASYESSTYLKDGEWAAGTITVSEDSYIGTLFIMPKDVKLKNLYVMFSTLWETSFEQDVVIRPFACLAVSNKDDHIFDILQNTITFTAPYSGGGSIPARTTRRGSKTDMNISIAEGSLVAIVAGIMCDNAGNSQSATLTINGGIYFE